MMNAELVLQGNVIPVRSQAALSMPVTSPMSDDDLLSHSDEWLRLVEEFQDLTWQTLVPAFMLVATLVLGTLACAHFLAAA